MCPDCKGKGTYQGLGKAEPCRTCQGKIPSDAGQYGKTSGDPFVVTKKADSRRVGSIPLMDPLFELWLYPETLAALQIIRLTPGIYLACRTKMKLASQAITTPLWLLRLGTNDIFLDAGSYKPFP